MTESLTELETRMRNSLRKAKKPYTRKHWFYSTTKKGNWLLQGTCRYDALSGDRRITIGKIFIPITTGTDPLGGQNE